MGGPCGKLGGPVALDADRVRGSRCAGAEKKKKSKRGGEYQGDGGKEVSW